MANYFETGHEMANLATLNTGLDYREADFSSCTFCSGCELQAKRWVELILFGDN